MNIEYKFDAKNLGKSLLKCEKILAKDLLLIRKLGLRDWNGRDFDGVLLMKYGRWTVSADKSVIFKALGGGACEIPEVYALIYKNMKILLESGGGGRRSSTQERTSNGGLELVYFISSISIPNELENEREHIRALAAEAFAVNFFHGSNIGHLTVRY